MRLLPMTSVSYHEYHPNKFWSVAASENMKVCDYFIYFTMTHIQEQRFAGIIQCCNKTFLCMTHPNVSETYQGSHIVYFLLAKFE